MTTTLTEKGFKNQLKERILPFWRRLADFEYGGFYGRVDWDLKVDKQSEKTIIGMSRILWTFSESYLRLKQKEDLKMAQHAYNYLTNHLYDKINGGFYEATTYLGALKRDKKHVIFQAYAIFSLSAYYDASRDEEALKMARKLFYLLEEKAFDEVQQRYKESFDAKWQAGVATLMAREDLVFDRTGVCPLHLLEAYTRLYQVWPDENLKERMLWLLDLFRDKIYQPAHQALGIYFDENWHLVSESFSYGRDIEASWLLRRAMKVLHIEDPVLSDQLLNMVQHGINRAMRTDGGYIISIENGVVDETLWWYAHAEAVVGLYEAYEETGNKVFLEKATQVYHKIEVAFLDLRPMGEWYPLLTPEGEPVPCDIAHPWKTPYHNGRMCFEMMDKLQKH